MANEPRVLIVDVDTDAAQRMGLALDGAGMQVSWCTFSPQEFGELQREFQPTLLLVHAEVGSPQLTTLLARADVPGGATLAVALLCRDTGDEVFVRPFRTGIVDMLQEPFSARLHLARLRTLLAELPERTGKLRGHGGPNEINGPGARRRLEPGGPRLFRAGRAQERPPRGRDDAGRAGCDVSGATGLVVHRRPAGCRWRGRAAGRYCGGARASGGRGGSVARGWPDTGAARRR